MKKFLPIVLLVVGVLVFAGVYFFVIRGSGKNGLLDEDAFTPEIPLEERPVASLTPTADGRWLNMSITGIKTEATSLDYELLYRVGDGRTQGVPGSVKLEGKTSIERDLLLGSESSGKFRYDEGVETGTLTLRFRNDKGKLVGKLSTEWHLQTNASSLTSEDGKFTYKLETIPKKTFFVTMETFGLPAAAPGDLTAGPYGVFSSGEKTHPGTVNFNNGYRWTGAQWERLDAQKSSNVGIFVELFVTLNID